MSWMYWNKIRPRKTANPAVCVDLYVSGLPLQTIAKMTGASRDFIKMAIMSADKWEERRGGHHTAAGDAKISASKKGKPNPKLSEAMRKTTNRSRFAKSAEHRRKIGDAHRGRKNPLAATLEHRQKVGEGVARALAAKWKHGSTYRDTSIERAVWAILDAVGVEYETSKQIGRFVVDIFVPLKNLVIECDGAYWHARPGRQERDQKKTEVLRAAGYTVLRLHEYEILNGGLAEFDVVEAVS